MINLAKFNNTQASIMFERFRQSVASLEEEVQSKEHELRRRARELELSRQDVLEELSDKIAGIEDPQARRVIRAHLLTTFSQS